MWDSIIKPTLVLFIVCAVISGALAYVNGVTNGTIQANTLAEQEQYRRQVLEDADSFQKIEREDFPETVEGVYEAFAANTPAGYVVEVSTKGYGGAISMTVGVNADGGITGVIVGNNNETPGLGSKATGSNFTGQFYAVSLGDLPESGLVVVKQTPKADHEIQAVSGATISSRAITRGVQAALDTVKMIEEGD